jgi:hypothetical protein
MTFMNRRRLLIATLLLGCGSIPILIGASCPPPVTPLYFTMISDATTLTVLPACQPGFVCVNFTNSTIIPVEVSLYSHSGFDPQNRCGDVARFECCVNPNSPVACPCPCAGALTGNCRLNRQQLFNGCLLDPATAHLDDINGELSVTLAPTQAVLKRIRCGDVKTLGAAVARAGVDPITAPDDRNGPIYRDEPGGVTCGGTVQFLVIDLTETTAGTGAGELVTLAIRPQFSR